MSPGTKIADAGDVSSGMRAHETAGDQITGQGHDRKRVRQFLRVARRGITDIKDNVGSRLVNVAAISAN
jgi:hypothetical protein